MKMRSADGDLGVALTNVALCLGLVSTCLPCLR